MYMNVVVNGFLWRRVSSSIFFFLLGVKLELESIIAFKLHPESIVTLENEVILVPLKT